jgi:hypothetical protein
MVDCIAGMESARVVATSMESFVAAIGVGGECEA